MTLRHAQGHPEPGRGTILVIAEQRDGTLNRATWETIAAAQRLAGLGADGAEKATDSITVVVPGAGAGRVAPELATAVGTTEVMVVEHAALAQYTPDGWTLALQGLIEQSDAAFVLLPHTYQTRDFAPMLAARVGKPLITDVTAITGTGGEAIFTRPMFQGKLVAQVKPRESGLAFVTIQIGAYRADAAQKGGAAKVTQAQVAVDESAIRQKPEAPFREARAAVDLGQAERIVAVGRGIKEQGNLPVAEKLAKAMGAELAASRPICDNGWLPMDRQVGSSGQTIAPKLYVALGISGAIQHLVGMKGSRTIVAINKDADAPIFEVADYGIVGDLFELAPAITAELEKA
ncbi:MAG TPA: electron transfer flavoprotein subunit alpha/FixB family protein [Vicinamibacterales bacterium]|nr:electron transfer flavoprotein subunit alpha/FixB family protein [Vicinamibacterales bacterium]